MLPTSGQKTTKDAYIAYAKELLKENQGYWCKYSDKTPCNHVYRREGNKIIEVMSYKRYKKIISAWFNGAKSYIIDGYALVLGNNLGRIQPRRVERNFANKQVNWEATHKMWKDTGVRKGHVYFLDEDWIRVAWNKTGKLRNRFLYKFKIAAGNSSGRGFKSEFVKANKINPMLKYRYEFYPYVIDKEENLK